MSKRLFIDLETTGVDSKQNGIHQIAGIVENNGKVVEKFNLNCQTFDDQIISKEALDIGGIDMETLLTYPDPRKTYRDLISILSKYVDKFNRRDKLFFVGYNSHFDNQFLREFFRRNNSSFFGSYFWSGTIDVMVLALQQLQAVRHELQNFKLSTVANHLGLHFTEEQLHDAMFDIELTREIYYKLTNQEN